MPASTCSSSILQNAPFEGRQPKKLLLGYPRPLHNLFSIFVEYDLMKQWNILVNFTEYFNQTGASVPSILFGQGTFTTRAGKVKNTKRFKMLEWSKQKNLNTWERHFFSFCSLSGWIKWNGREKISYQLSLLWVEASGLPEKKKKRIIQQCLSGTAWQTQRRSRLSKISDVSNYIIIISWQCHLAYISKGQLLLNQLVQFCCVNKFGIVLQHHLKQNQL